MFEFLINVALKNRIIVLFLAALMVLVGIYTQSKMNIDVFPELSKTTITITTSAHGLGPKEVEDLVTIPIETQIAGIAGSSRIRSFSKPGISIILVELKWGADLYKARQLIAERLKIVASKLPPFVSPQMNPVTSFMGKVALVAVTGDNADGMALREFVDWTILPRLSSIPGVSSVIAQGGLKRQIQISPKLIQMRNFEIDQEMIKKAAQGFGSVIGGVFDGTGSQEMLFKPMAESMDLDDLRNIVVDKRDGSWILLSQVADVSFSHKPRTGDAGFNGKDAIVIAIDKAPSVNTILLTKKIEETLESIQSTLPKSVEIENFIFKQADFINASVNVMNRVLLDAVIAIVIVLILLMSNTQSTFITLVAIPASIFFTFIILKLLGQSVNIMTIGGLAIAVGEIVDDSIVDLENIGRRLGQNNQSKRPKKMLNVIAEASQEIRSGLIYSTLIIVCAILPIYFLPGLEGALFSSLVLTFVVAILCSFVVSISITPVLASFLLSNNPRVKHAEGFLVKKIKLGYSWFLNRIFNNPTPFIAIICIVSVVSVFSVFSLSRSFLPSFNESSIFAKIVLKPGTTLGGSNEITNIAEVKLLQIPEIVSVGSRTGADETDSHQMSKNEIEFEMQVAVKDRKMKHILRDVRSSLSSLPGNKEVGHPVSHRLIDHILTGQTTEVVLKIFGERMDILRSTAEVLKQKLENVPGIVDLGIESVSLVPQMEIITDPIKAKLYGLTSMEVNRQLELFMSGKVVSEIIHGNRTVEVIVRLSEENLDKKAIENSLIDTAVGKIPLYLVAEVRQSLVSNDYRHEDLQRRLLVTANVDEKNADNPVERIQNIIKSFDLPEGYYIKFEGRYAEANDALIRVLILSVVSLIGIFLLLYHRYKSILICSIIMSNIPLCIAGGVLAVAITGIDLSVAALIGFVSLIGINARNSILKINHFVNLLKNEGEIFGRKMIFRGSAERLLPVLLTATTCCVALVPLLLHSESPGTEFIYPVAVVIFGGLITATILDAFLVPFLMFQFAEAALSRVVRIDAEES